MLLHLLNFWSYSSCLYGKWLFWSQNAICGWTMVHWKSKSVIPRMRWDLMVWRMWRKSIKDFCLFSLDQDQWQKQTDKQFLDRTIIRQNSGLEIQNESREMCDVFVSRKLQTIILLWSWFINLHSSGTPLTLTLDKNSSQDLRVQSWSWGQF